jgi:hypothetical protein
MAMSGIEVKFNLPPYKSIKVCALEGSIKARAGVQIVKKELCMADTPEPKFLKPKKSQTKPPIADFKFNIPDIRIPPIVFNPPIKANIGLSGFGNTAIPDLSGLNTNIPKNIRDIEGILKEDN